MGFEEIYLNRELSYIRWEIRQTRNFTRDKYSFRSKILDLGSITHSATKCPLEAAQQKGLYFEAIDDLIEWLGAVPVDELDVAVIPTFSNIEEYERLIRATSDYEIALDYVAQEPTQPHLFAGVSGITEVLGGSRLFFTAYGHSDGEGEFSDRREERVFSDKDHIDIILKDIGVIGGDGYLVVVKGNEKSVSPQVWKYFFKSDDVVFQIHTHSEGFYNFVPSTETNNASNNPFGGDYAFLERKLRSKPNQLPPEERPQYLVLPESNPLAISFSAQSISTSFQKIIPYDKYALFDQVVFTFESIQKYSK